MPAPLQHARVAGAFTYRCACQPNTWCAPRCAAPAVRARTACRSPRASGRALGAQQHKACQNRTPPNSVGGLHHHLKSWHADLGDGLDDRIDDAHAVQLHAGPVLVLHLRGRRMLCTRNTAWAGTQVGGGGGGEFAWQDAHANVAESASCAVLAASGIGRGPCHAAWPRLSRSSAPPRGRGRAARAPQS